MCNYIPMLGGWSSTPWSRGFQRSDLETACHVLSTPTLGTVYRLDQIEKLSQNSYRFSQVHVAIRIHCHLLFMFSFFRGIRRKKIADFYHRTSMSSYCTAFAYRPLVEDVSDEMASAYLEVPEDIGVFQNPTTSRSA